MFKQSVFACMAFSITLMMMVVGSAFLLTPTPVHATTEEYCDNIVYTSTSSGKDKNIREPDVTGRSACSGVGTTCKIVHIANPTSGGYTVSCEVYLAP